MKNHTPMRARTMLVALTILCTTATAAHAIDSCKVKVDKHNGVILVDATAVAGPLLWGNESGQETNALFNSGTCVSAGKAKKCQLADPSTLASKSPPSGCTLYLNDGATPCSAWIPGCTPSPRSGSGALLKDSTGAVIGYAADSTGQYAIREESGVNLRLTLLPDGTGFASGGYIYYLSNDCSGLMLMAPDTYMVKSVNAVSNTLGVYAPNTGTTQNLQSLLYLQAGVNDQAGCDGYFGPGTTFTAPHGCCGGVVVSATMGSASSFNLGQFVAPFVLEVQ